MAHTVTNGRIRQPTGTAGNIEPKPVTNPAPPPKTHCRESQFIQADSEVVRKCHTSGEMYTGNTAGDALRFGEGALCSGQRTTQRIGLNELQRERERESDGQLSSNL